jgi:hypothetical protein
MKDLESGKPRKYIFENASLAGMAVAPSSCEQADD